MKHFAYSSKPQNIHPAGFEQCVMLVPIIKPRLQWSGISQTYPMVAAMDLMDSEGGDEVPEYLDKQSNGCISL